MSALESAPADEAAVARVLAAAGPRDGITLVTIAALAREPGRRRTVLSRLVVLSPPPGGMTLDDMDDPALFDLWRDDVVDAYQTHRIF